MFVQLGATWDCMLATHGVLRQISFQRGATWDCILATYRVLRGKFVQLGVLYVGNLRGFETEVCSTWGFLGLRVSKLQGFGRKFVQLGTTWDRMLATHGVLRWMFCPTWGYLGLYVGNLRGFGRMCVQLGATWDCILTTYGALRRMFCHLRATGEVCW